MGFPPREVDRMTVWELMACMDGVAAERGWKVRGGGGDLSEDELREMGIVGFEGPADG